MDRREAVAAAHGFGVTKLLDTGNVKAMKSGKHGWLTAVLHLAPFKVSGVMNVCPHASKGCAAACIYTAGLGVMESVKEARIRKTVFFKHARKSFVEILHKDVEALKRSAERQGKKLCVRLNATSDLPWGKLARGLMEAHPDVQFYDYTKNPARVMALYRKQLPANYDITFSRSESNDADVKRVLRSGARVAVVFELPFPKTWRGKKIIDGDAHDMRFTEPDGVVIGLSAKGDARRDLSGFVVRHPRLFGRALVEWTRANVVIRGKWKERKHVSSV